jgi:hypothetical protein
MLEQGDAFQFAPNAEFVFDDDQGTVQAGNDGGKVKGFVDVMRGVDEVTESARPKQPRSPSWTTTDGSRSPKSFSQPMSLWHMRQRKERSERFQHIPADVPFFHVSGGRLPDKLTGQEENRL